MEKHILIVTTTHDFLWKFERDNVDLLQRMGYVVHYAANLNEPAYRSDEARFQEMGVWAHHIDIARSPFLFAQNKRALRQLLWLVHRFRIQAIHCHTPVGGVLGRLAGRLCEGQRPVVMYTAHGFHFYKGAPVFNWLTYYQVERLLARDTDVLIVINEEDYQAARHFRLRKGGRLYKIPGVGLDTEVFRPLSETMRNDLRARLGLQTKDFFLVSVGELNENKNQVVVLKALEKLRQEEADGFSYRYGICGDGFLRKKMERWIEERKMQDTVTLYGFCPNVAEVLGCADAAVFPSKREGLGMAGLEALAMGIPVIAADNRGTREYMQDGKNGFVCHSGDVDGFVRGIRAVKSLDEERRRQMKEYFFRSVEAFGLEHAHQVMRRIYLDVDGRIEPSSYGTAYQSQHYHGGV